MPLMDPELREAICGGPRGCTPTLAELQAAQVGTWPPETAMGTKAEAYLALAAIVLIVWAIIAIVRHRKRIASTAADKSIDALATGVRLSRTLSRAAKNRLASLRDRINERADR